MKNVLKRSIALLLSLLMLASVSVFAEELPETDTALPAETAQEEPSHEEMPAEHFVDKTAAEDPLAEEETPMPEEEPALEEEPLPEESLAEEPAEEDSFEEEPLSTVLLGEGEDYVASGDFGDNITWTLDQRGTLVLTGTGAMPKETAPWYDMKKEVKSVVIGDGITSVEENTFFNHYSIVSLSLPNTLTTIATSGFYKCGALKALHIPASVTSIGTQAFEACTDLTSITVDPANTVYGASGNCLYVKSTKTMIAGCKTSTIPTDGSVTRIGDRAFYWYETLQSIRIPASVTEIGAEAFMNCTSLTSVTMDGVVSIGSCAFLNDPAMTFLVLPPSLKSVGSRAIGNCRALKEVYFTGTQEEWSNISIESDNDSLLNADIYYEWSETHGKCLGSGDADSLHWGVYEDGALVIKGNAAMSDYSLDSAPWTQEFRNDILSVDIQEGVTTIGKNAFFGLTNVTSVSIPSSVTKIGERAFEGTAVTAIHIPAGVNQVDHSALAGCVSLAAITADPANATFAAKDNCLIEKSTKTLIAGCKNSVIPEDGSVTKIGFQAFYNCIGLTSITVPRTVTEIEDDAFCMCSGLENVKLCDGLLTIGKNAFRGCGVTSVKFPTSVTEIGADAFASCESLTSVTMENGVVSIGSCAFMNDIAMTFLVLPPSLKTVGSLAINNCAALKEVYFTGTQEEWSNISIGSANDSLLAADIYYEWSETHGKCLGSGDVDALHWCLYEDGALILKGSGEVPDFTPGETPWAADAVKSAIIDAGITGIGSNVFYGTVLESADFLGSEEQLAALMKNVDTGNESFLSVIQRRRAGVSIDKEYIVLAAGDDVELSAYAFPEGSVLEWEIDDGAIAECIPDGSTCTVIGKSQGRAYVTVTATECGESVSACCRVDVTEAENSIEGVALADKKAAVNLFSADYAKIGIVLLLPQNYSLLGYTPAPKAPEGKGVAVKGAEFADETVRTLFDLVPADDRSFLIVPKAETLAAAQDNAKAVGKKYSSAVTVFFDEAGTVSMTTGETLAFTVSQKLPKVTAKTVTLNICHPSDIKPVVITGGSVKSLTFDWATTEWAELTPGGIRLKAGLLPQKGASAKLYCYAELEGWLYRFPVAVTVKAVKTAPTLTVKVTGAIDTAIENSPAKVAVSIKNASATFAPSYILNVKDAAGTDVTEKFNVSAADNGYTLTANAADKPAVGTYTIQVSADTEQNGEPDAQKTAKLTVKASVLKNPTVPLSAKVAGYIDPRLPGSSVTLTFKNYYCCGPDDGTLTFLRTDVIPGVTTDAFEVTFSDGAFVIQAKPGMLEPGAKYAVYFTKHVGDKDYCTKVVNIPVKKGKLKLAADVKELLLYAKDVNSEGFFGIPGITEMTEGTCVKVAGKKAAMFTLRELGDGQYALGHHGTAKSGTITLNVFAEGNATTKPDTTVKIRVTVK